jgi:hypothetical protein
MKRALSKLIVPFVSFHLVSDIRQKRDLTCFLNGLCQLTLMHCTGTGGSAGQNLAALGHVAAKLCSILIVNVLALVNTELAHFSALAILVVTISINSQDCILLFDSFN